MIENIKPMDIEKRSFEIITEILGDRKFPEEQESIIKRVIHTSADFDYADNLKFSPNAVEKALEALRSGCDIVTDTNMAKAGINKTILGSLGGEVHCFMADPDVAKEAKERGVTRALVSMERAAGLGKKLVFALGNAPTALISLYEMMKAGKYSPDFVIGVPVGFVNVVAAKELINDFRLGGHSNYQICTIVDDNPTKLGRYLEGHCIEGNRYDIPELARKYEIDIIIVAIPSASNEDRISILNICQETGCKLQIVPGIYQIVNGDVQVSRLRDVQIEDLLGRDEVKINLTEIKKTIEGKVVMVTGGGGSIGSELCRQIASANPKQLIIFDIYENNAYAIQQELIRKYGDKLNLVTLIGSVRNTSRINSVLETYHPEMIYHAAAHKHVPLMENSPCEAIKNNVMGTYKLAKAAAEHGVKRFLLISTDKAVNPTSLMGATKRMCEMIIQMMDRKYPGTTFMAVRFGNVLGSNGSVIPLFKEQIAKGGPVTVTDKNIIRYFMTIPEAVSLVLEASIYAKGGEIFVLDMGKPVRIDDMARKLIRLSGFQPDVDIKIVYTGLRPGEKLYEELLMDEEGMKDTPNKLIHIGHPIEMDDELFLQQIHRLDQVSKQEVEPMEMKRVVSEVVTTYKPDLEHVDQSQGVIAS